MPSDLPQVEPFHNPAGGIKPSPLSLAWGPDVPTLIERNGQYYLNPHKSQAKWRWANGTVGASFPATVPAAGGQIEFDVQVGGGRGQRGDFEVGAFLMTLSPTTNRVAVKPYVSSPINKQLSNVPIPSTLMCGTAQLPGLLQSSIYSVAKSFWRLTVVNCASSVGTTSVSPVLYGRRFTDKRREDDANVRRLAHFASVAVPYWIGPQSQEANKTGPEVTLLAGQQIKLRFPTPSWGDFLIKWILDDSTSTTGVEPVLTAQIVEEDSQRGFVDKLPTGASGISWRDFLACPTVSVTGFPSGGQIRAFSLGSPKGGYTTLVKRNSAVEITFISGDAGTITLRPALVGWVLAADEPQGRHYSNTREAIRERASPNLPITPFGGR